MRVRRTCTPEPAAPVVPGGVTALARQSASHRRRFPGDPRLTDVLGFLVGAALGLSSFYGGLYSFSDWGPVAAISACVLAALLARRSSAPAALSRATAFALVGLAAWTLLSALWAESVAQAVVEANRWLLYAAWVGCLFMLMPRDRRVAVALLAGFGAGIVATALYLVAGLLLGHTELIAGGRLFKPVQYANAQAAYLLFGFWPAVAAAERARPVYAGLALATATMLAGLALLCQTRAVVPAFVLSAMALLAIVPGRRRRVWALCLALGAIAAVMPALIDVYDEDRAGPLTADTTRSAGIAILGAALAAGLLWAVGTAALKQLGGRSAPSARRVGDIALAIAVVAALAISVAAVERPFQRLDEQLDAFRSLEGTAQADLRLVSGGGNRYDYWRIAIHEFERQPLIGVGAGNFDRYYFLERRTNEDVRQPHSIELQALSELGVVGAALLAVFLACVLSGLWRVARSRDSGPVDSARACAAGGIFLVWLLHTSVDWLHLLPGLTLPALTAAGFLVWARPREGTTARGVGWTAVMALLAIVTAVSLSRSLLADTWRHDAKASLNSDPRRAVGTADRALAIDPYSLETRYVRAAALARLGDARATGIALLEAARREPHDPVPWVLLGDVYARLGRTEEARAGYRKALSLNPRDSTLRRLVEEGPPPPP